MSNYTDARLKALRESNGKKTKHEQKQSPIPSSCSDYIKSQARKYARIEAEKARLAAWDKAYEEFINQYPKLKLK